MSETQRKSHLTVIFMTVFIYLLGFGIVIPIIPLLSRDFGANALEAGLLLSAYSLMQFLFSPFWGRLSDRYGRRRILLGCLLGESLTYLLFAVARDLPMLFAARLLAGFFGASISTASAAITDLTPPKERSKGLALIGVAFGLGFMFGPAIGGLLAMWGKSLSSAPHFQTSFTMSWVSVLCFVTFLFGCRYLPETRKFSDAPTVKGHRFASLGNFFSRPVVGTLMAVFFVSSFAMASMEASLVLYMGDKFSWGLREVSFGFAYIGVMIVVTQGLIVRRLLPKFGERFTLRLGLASFTLGLAGIALAPNIGMMAVAMTLLSVGSGLSNPSLLGSISLLSPTEEQGTAMGATQSLASLGRILGPAFGGFLFDHLHPTAPFVGGATFALLALLTVFSLGLRVPDTARQEA
ncbi:MAG: MFS transporter [Bdellovibrionaceae bacterium]|nr:MFS transporter [Pseudobdellovibrionaceae bacterium]